MKEAAMIEAEMEEMNEQEGDQWNAWPRTVRPKICLIHRSKHLPHWNKLPIFSFYLIKNR